MCGVNPVCKFNSWSWIKAKKTEYLLNEMTISACKQIK